MDKIKIDWVLTNYSEMTRDELYAILKIRAEVFVVEQHCYYLDADDKDFSAQHLQGFVDGSLVAYCRLFSKGTEHEKSASIGRVLVAKEYRTAGVGHALIKEALDVINEEMEEESVVISAQCYLIKFYEKHGFSVVGSEYMDAGVPHIRMDKSLV